MHLEQIWAVRRLLLGLHAQKKQCFVLDSWIITVTAEHSAKLANSKMRPEDSFMHHDLRFCCMFLPEKGLWQGRLEAQVFRMLAPIRMPAFISLTTLRALSDKSLAKRSTALRKDHWMSTSRHSRKNYLKCLKNALAFSAPNQAHNLTNIFHTNAFSNMLLEGSSARVLQRSLLPSYTGAVFNSSGARLRELCQQGGTKLSQGDFLLVWRVMLAHYPWKLMIYLCCIIRVIVFYTLYYIIYHNYSPTHLSTVLPSSHESRAKASDLGWLQLFWFWSKAAEV